MCAYACANVFACARARAFCRGVSMRACVCATAQKTEFDSQRRYRCSRLVPRSVLLLNENWIQDPQGSVVTLLEDLLEIGQLNLNSKYGTVSYRQLK